MMLNELNIQTIRNGEVECGICQRHCRVPLRVGSFGVCGTIGVEQSNKGLSLLTDGYFPIRYLETLAMLPVKGFREEEAPILSLGGIGCNLRCQFCFNQRWSFQKADRISSPERRSGDTFSPQGAVDLAKDLCVEGMAFGYAEPITYFPWVLAASQLAQEEGMFTVLQTNGLASERAIHLLAPFLSVYRVGLKGPQEVYDQITPGISLERILANTVLVKSLGVHVEITSLLVPGLSDSETSIGKLALMIRESLDRTTPFHLERYHQPIGGLESLPSSTSEETMGKALDIAKAAGLDRVFIFDSEDIDRL